MHLASSKSNSSNSDDCSGVDLEPLETEKTTELQAVIAELRKQLATKNSKIIIEEDEIDEKPKRPIGNLNEEFNWNLTRIQKEHEAIKSTLISKEIELDRLKNLVREISKDNRILKEVKGHHGHGHSHPGHGHQPGDQKVCTAKITKLKTSQTSELPQLSTKILETILLTPILQATSSELEKEVLFSKIENLKHQNQLLYNNLVLAKNHSERLQESLAVYESNVIVGDSALEGYDILVALLESELGQLLANCRAVGIGIGNDVNQDNINILLSKANENKQTAVNAACKFVNQNSLSGISKTTPVETKLRQILIRLKTEREKMKKSLDLKSQEDPPPPPPPPEEWDSLNKGPKYASIKNLYPTDLEMAVLLQELAAVREERNLLKLQLGKILNCW